MKIAVVVGMFPKISETFIVSQIKGLIERGHEVTIIAKDRAGELPQSDVIDFKLIERTLYPRRLARSKIRRLLAFGLDWLRLLVAHPKRAIAALPLAMPLNSPGLRRFYFAMLFHGREFDVVHCHFGFMGKLIADLGARGLVDCPVITSFHGVDIGSGVSVDRYRQLHRRGAKFTANSQFSANRAIELGCPAERIALLPVGISLDDFPFSERRLNSSEPLRLITVGRLIESKGIHIALEAIARLADDGYDVRYDIIGDGPERDRLEQLALAKHILRLVSFHGALLREEVIALLGDAHLFVLPSLGMEGQITGMEGQGLVLQEAQAMGLPVIASRCCGIPEGVIEGETGLLCPEGNPEALADRIREMHQAHQRWPELGTRGRQLVERKFDIENLNDRLVEIYEDTAAIALAR